MYDLFKDTIKINKYPLTKGQALTMQRLTAINYGYVPKIIKI